MTSITSLINTLTNKNTSSETPGKSGGGLRVKTGVRGGKVRIPRDGVNHNQTVIR